MLYEIIAADDRISFSNDTVSNDTVVFFPCAIDARPHSRAPDTPSSTR
jgi:hypothetical protein